jgi:hypothetical protein
MDQNTNFKVGDIVAINSTQLNKAHQWLCEDERPPGHQELIQVKIVRITPKRFLVEWECPDDETDSSDEEGEARRPMQKVKVFVKHVMEIA